MSCRKNSEDIDRLRRFYPRLKSGDPLVRDEIAAALTEMLPRLVRPSFHQKFTRLKLHLQTDDIAQDVMLRLLNLVFDNLPETEDWFIGGIRQTIRWTLFDLVRKYYGPLGEGSNSTIGLPIGVEPATTDGQTAREATAHLESALARLPKYDAGLIIDRYYLEIEIQEIAELYGVNRGTIRLHLNRAIRRLGDLLES